MFPTTFDTETELSSINSILGSIGQAPVTTLDYENPEIALVYRVLDEVSNQVQAEGWVFNTEYRYPLVPNSEGFIEFPQNILQMDLSDTESNQRDVVKRQGKLYDKLNHTYKFEGTIYADIVWKFEFEDLPHAFKQYITYRAARIAATRLIGDVDMFKLLTDQEQTARAICLEYECNQGDYNFLGYPRGTDYRTYKPYTALNR
jgi:hypothetical protein